jgi:hypothetical protein
MRIPKWLTSMKSLLARILSVVKWVLMLVAAAAILAIVLGFPESLIQPPGVSFAKGWLLDIFFHIGQFGLLALLLVSGQIVLMRMRPRQFLSAFNMDLNSSPLPKRLTVWLTYLACCTLLVLALPPILGFYAYYSLLYFSPPGVAYLDVSKFLTCRAIFDPLAKVLSYFGEKRECGLGYDAALDQKLTYLGAGLGWFAGSLLVSGALVMFYKVVLRPAFGRF